MARGTWEDFTSKWGFNDGESTEDRDFRARDALVKLLNRRPEMKAEGIRAVAYDRPGMHNSCLILLLKEVPGKSDEDLLKNYFADSAAQEQELPEMEVYIYDLIDRAYRSRGSRNHDRQEA